MHPLPVAPSIPAHAGRRPARGVAMIVVLLFLLAVTGLAIFAARNSAVSEGMARNQLDEEAARQAAETALRDAERDLLLTGVKPAGAICDRGAARPTQDAETYFLPSCLTGQCSLASPAYSVSDWTDTTKAEPWWPTAKGGLWGDDATQKPSATSTGTCTTFTGGVPLGTFTGATPVRGVAQQPEYLIEYFRRGLDTYFRITARGFGFSANTQIVLQTYFKPFPAN